MKKYNKYLLLKTKWIFKMNYRNLIVGFVLILFAVNLTNAQTLDSLISEALNNNQQLKGLGYKIKSAEYKIESANTLPAPTLGIEFSQIPVSSLNIIDDAISNSVSISQMFPIGGKPTAMAEVEKKNVNIEQNNLEVYKVNLIAKIKMTYYNLWLLERKIEIQNKSIILLNDLLSSINTLYQINRINQADLLSIKSETASNQTQLLNLNRDATTEIYKLNQLLGRNLSSKSLYTVLELKTDSLNISQDKLETILSNINPSLKRMRNMIEMNKAMIYANNKELIPDLMIQGMVMRMPQGMFLTSKTDLNMLAMGRPKTEYMYSIMASITLPFAPWSVKKYTAREEELLSGIKAIEYEKTNMQQEMILGLQEAFTKLNTAKDLIKLYSQNVIPLYQQTAEVQTSNYQNGQTSINSVIDSYQMLLMQQMNLFMAKADYNMAIAEIEMMVGKEIKNGELNNEIF
ncbi:MAG: TolC family protein [bacterium]